MRTYIYIHYESERERERETCTYIMIGIHRSFDIPSVFARHNRFNITMSAAHLQSNLPGALHAGVKVYTYMYIYIYIYIYIHIHAHMYTYTYAYETVHTKQRLREDSE